MNVNNFYHRKMAFRQILKIFSIKTSPFNKYALALIVAKCSSFDKPNIQFRFPDLKTEHLSFDYMLKQSTVDIVNNVSQILTVTYTAVESISQEYRSLLAKLISLIKESIMIEIGDDQWDQILQLKSQIQDKKETITHLIQHMDYVHKMAMATSNVCYSTGMDNLSQTLCQRIDDALNKVQNEVIQNQQLESEYTDIQKQSIIKSTKTDGNVKNIIEE